jgi:hypothetical protein
MRQQYRRNMCLLALGPLVLGLGGCKAPVNKSAVVPPKPGATPGGLGSAALLTAKISGQVLSPDGRPAANTTIRVGLITNDGGTVISNDGATVVSNDGATVISNDGATVISNDGATVVAKGYQLAQVASPLKTDAAGRFSVTVPGKAAVVVEAIGSEQLKALAPNVRAGSGELRLQLAPTGTLAGRVSVPDQPAISDLTGVDVFIPGTTYLAKCDAAGAFTIAGVPSGDFVLVAQRENLGHASAVVHVRPNEKTTVQTLALGRTRPFIAAAVPPIAAPGIEVEIHGDGFGATTGANLQLSLAGTLLVQTQRINDHTLRVTLPATAVSGDLNVVVGGVAGAPLPYAVAKRLVPLPGRDSLLKGESLALEALAVDANDHPLGDVPATWSATGDGSEVNAGRAIAHASGTSTLTCTLGALSGSVTLPIRAAVAIPGVLYDHAERAFNGLTFDPHTQKLFSVDLGTEGTTGGVTTLDAAGILGAVKFDPGATRSRPKEVTVAADGTPAVLAADNSLWTLPSTGPAHQLLDAAALKSAIPVPGSGVGTSGPGGASSAAQAGVPAGLAGDLPQGHGLVADALGRLVFQLLPGLAIRVSPDGAPVGVPFAPPTQPGQASPAFQLAPQGRGLIAFIPRPNLMPGLLVIDDAGRHELVELSQDVGTVSGMATDGQGRVYLASSSLHAVFEVDAKGAVRALSTHPSEFGADRGGPLSPGALAVDSAGTTLWAIDGDHPGRVWRFGLQRS